MSGIAGIVDLKGTRDIDRKVLERMTHALAHRGPDGQGFHVEPGVGLGHRRLAVPGRSPNKQPFTAQRGRTVVALDGALTNTRDLRQELAATGRPIRTRSDVEVAAEMVDLRGAEAVTALHGLFAMAAWDPRSEQLTLARDRFGGKPLYTSVTETGFLIFASEVDALLASGWTADLLDPDAVCDFIFYGFVPDPKSIYRGIAKLAPGHSLTFRRGRPLPAPRAWGSVKGQPDPHFLPDAAANGVFPMLEAALEKARCDDTPLPLLLGDDIGSAVMLTAALTEDPPRPPVVLAEAPGRIGAVTEYFGISGQPAAAPAAMSAILPALAGIFAEPVASPDVIATILALQGLGGARSAASAAGAAALFAEDARYPAALRDHRIRRLLPAAVRTLVTRPLGRICPAPGVTGASGPGLKDRLWSLSEHPATAYARSAAHIAPELYARLVSPELRAYRPQTLAEQAYAGTGVSDPALAASLADMSLIVPGRTLTLLDRTSAAAGVNVLTPFMDPVAADWALALPRAAKVWRGGGARVLHMAMDQRLGTETQIPRHRHTASAADGWFAAEGGALLDRLLASEAWRDSGYFADTEVERLADRQRRGKGRYGQALWTILMFDAFLTRDRSARQGLLVPAPAERPTAARAVIGTNDRRAVA